MNSFPALIYCGLNEDFSQVSSSIASPFHKIKIRENNEVFIKQVSIYNGSIILCNILDEVYYFDNSDEYCKLSNDLIKVHFDDSIKLVGCGLKFYVVVTKEDEVFVYGNNKKGQLDVLTMPHNIPTFTKLNLNIKNICKVVCSDYNCVLITAIGESYISGFNNCFKTNQATTFTKINFITKDIKFGYKHCILITKRNEIYGNGNNSLGQLGLGDSMNRKEFEKVQQFYEIVEKVECGDFYTLILTKAGNIYTSGRHKLLSSSYNNGFEFTQSTVFKHLIFPFHVPVLDVSISDCHIVIRTINDEFYGCGSNKVGQLGFLEKENRVELTKMNIPYSWMNNVKCEGYSTYFYYSLEKEELTDIYRFKNNLKIALLQSSKLCDISIDVDFEQRQQQQAVKSLKRKNVIDTNNSFTTTKIRK
ncbi:hypothetical protein ABK040_001076 [Willaertia magna]